MSESMWSSPFLLDNIYIRFGTKKEVREKSRECHIHKPQPFPDPKRKRKPTNPHKHKSNKCTKSTKISSLFPKRGNRNTKRIEKHKNKMTHGKTYNKSPRRINHKATKSKTNTGTKLFRQIVGIPIGTNCAALVADLLLFCYERDFMMSHSVENQSEIIEAFSSTSRYLEDLLNFDNTYFDGLISQIYAPPPPQTRTSVK